MYLIIDEQYRVFKAPIMSGYIRSQVKQGKLSIVNLGALEGMNIDGTWAPVQELPLGFKVDEQEA